MARGEYIKLRNRALLEGLALAIIGLIFAVAIVPFTQEGEVVGFADIIRPAIALPVLLALIWAFGFDVIKLVRLSGEQSNG